MEQSKLMARLAYQALDDKKGEVPDKQDVP